MCRTTDDTNRFIVSNSMSWGFWNERLLNCCQLIALHVFVFLVEQKWELVTEFLNEENKRCSLFWFCSPSSKLLHAISVNDLNTFDTHAKHTSSVRDTSSQKLLLVLASPGYTCRSPGFCQHLQPGPTTLAAPIPEGRPHITDQQQQMQVVPTSCKHSQGERVVTDAGMNFLLGLWSAGRWSPAETSIPELPQKF